MQPLHYTLFFHFVGIGLIFAALFGGWLLNKQ